MEDLYFYFRLGWAHIVSPDALDHQLFILSLIIGKSWKSWKRLLIIISAFTIGHCLTLALAATGQIRISTYWVELLIPCTIIVTALFQWKLVSQTAPGSDKIYTLAGFFGLIHGLGFAKTLQSILGKSQSILMPLFGFNLGLEFGQIAFLVTLLTVQSIIMFAPFVSKQVWQRTVIGLSIFGSIWMVVERI